MCRTRLIMQLSAQVVRNLTTSLLMNLASGTPYTFQTGLDNNGDLIFNDRPEGVERNTERAKGQLSLNANVTTRSRSGRRIPQRRHKPVFRLRRSTASSPHRRSRTISVPQAGRYRVSVFAQVQNLTNRANYLGYSGVLTSPFFGRPRDVINPRLSISV